MIKKMRLKFIAITMGSLLFLLAAILIATNVYMYMHSQKQIDDFLNNIVSRDGLLIETDRQMNTPPPQENRNLIDGFSVSIDAEGEIVEILNSQSSISNEDAMIYTDEVLSIGETSGKVGNLKYLVQSKSYGTIIAFANQSIQDILLEELRRLSYIIGVISITFLFGLVIVLSKLVTKPVEIAFEKQKRFISDSSHELKTPLSILSANVDVLEMEIGENKWLSQMRQQSQRMNKLIHELLVLAKTEAVDENIVFSNFDLSHAVLNTVLPFEVIAFEHEKEIECDIAEGVNYHGDKQNIKKMVGALMDNAVKYSYEKTTIKVKLDTRGTKKIIEIYNQGQGVTDSQKDRLFDKFYRVDDSRARETGGYGIGLSIVKNIVDMHNGRIEIDSKPGEYILFRVIFPN